MFWTVTLTIISILKDKNTSLYLKACYNRAHKNILEKVKTKLYYRSTYWTHVIFIMAIFTPRLSLAKTFELYSITNVKFTLSWYSLASPLYSIKSTTKWIGIITHGWVKYFRKSNILIQWFLILHSSNQTYLPWNQFLQSYSISYHPRFF